MIGSKNKIIVVLQVIGLLCSFSHLSSKLQAQTARPDDSGPATKSAKGRPKGKTVRGPKADPKGAGTAATAKARFANISLTVNPADSAVWIDGQQFDKVDTATGRFEVTIEPGPHRLVVRHSGYGDQLLTLDLRPAENDLGVITLEPRLGTLNVAPSAADADIRIGSVDGHQNGGTYSGIINDLGLPPGVYEVIVSKSGYQTVTRQVTVKPGESVYLEPKLDPLPTEEPKTRRSVNTGTPASSSVHVEGKYLVVEIQGASGDSALTLGSITFLISDPASGSGQAEGILSGGPCQVEFVRLENVAEGSFIETPGPTNHWARLVLRIRPKNSKRPIQFAINWKSVQL